MKHELLMVSAFTAFVLAGCPVSTPPPYCEDTCATADDGVCDDGREWSAGDTCAPGTDCSDCGPNFDAPVPQMPGADGEAFGTPRSHTPVAPPSDCAVPIVDGWYCTSGGDGFYYQGHRSPAMCVTTVPYSCGEDRRCVSDPSTGQAAGCLLDGADPTERVETCEVVGCCDTGLELRWCSDVPGMLPIPPIWEHRDIELRYEMGSVRHVYQERSDGVPAADDSIELVQGWCMENRATSYVGPSACSMGMCTASCPSGTTCVDGTCVGTGVLRFTLSWGASADLDLYVMTPGGSTISYRNSTADGGMLDHDDTDGGPGSVENVFFTTAANGTYTVWVNHFSGDPASFNLEIYAGTTRLDRRGGSLDPGTESGRYTIEFP